MTSFEEVRQRLEDVVNEALADVQPMTDEQAHDAVCEQIRQLAVMQYDVAPEDVAVRWTGDQDYTVTVRRPPQQLITVAFTSEEFDAR